MEREEKETKDRHDAAEREVTQRMISSVKFSILPRGIWLVGRVLGYVKRGCF